MLQSEDRYQRREASWLRSREMIDDQEVGDVIRKIESGRPVQSGALTRRIRFAAPQPRRWRAPFLFQPSSLLLHP